MDAVAAPIQPPPESRGARVGQARVDGEDPVEMGLHHGRGRPRDGRVKTSTATDRVESSRVSKGYRVEKKYTA
jgi:hypothetical protein